MTPKMTTQKYDYIIIGAGSAGCVLANRLSEDPATSVLVLEFGGSDKSVVIQMPSAFSIPMNTKKYNWRYETEPETYLNGRRIHCPRGKVLGGSSSINGLVYIRGHALTSTSGNPSAPRAGATRIACRTSSVPKATSPVATAIAGRPGRCTPPTATT